MILLEWVGIAVAVALVIGIPAEIIYFRRKKKSKTPVAQEQKTETYPLAIVQELQSQLAEAKQRISNLEFGFQPTKPTTIQEQKPDPKQLFFELVELDEKDKAQTTIVETAKTNLEAEKTKPPRNQGAKGRDSVTIQNWLH